MTRPDDSTPDLDLDLDEAKRAAHATEPGMGDHREAVNDPNTIADDVVDPDQDDEQAYPPSKPVPTDGGGPLP